MKRDLKLYGSRCVRDRERFRFFRDMLRVTGRRRRDRRRLFVLRDRLLLLLERLRGIYY